MTTDKLPPLPEYWKTHSKIDDGVELDPIEQFIHDNEPSGKDDEVEFRSGLQAALQHAHDRAQRVAPAEALEEAMRLARQLELSIEWGIRQNEMRDNLRAYLSQHLGAQRVAGAEPAKPKLLGWRTADLLMETSDIDKARNWEAHYEMQAVFEGDPYTKLSTAPPHAEPVGGSGVLPSHRCKVCGALWRFWPERDTGRPDSWGLNSIKCGACCDVAPMADQIEPLTWEMLPGATPPASTAGDAAQCDREAFDPKALYDQVQAIAASLHYPNQIGPGVALMEVADALRVEYLARSALAAKTSAAATAQADLRNLFVKYIRQVGLSEGVDFIPSIAEGTDFVDSELVILRALAAESDQLE